MIPPELSAMVSALFTASHQIEALILEKNVLKSAVI